MSHYQHTIDECAKALREAKGMISIAAGRLKMSHQGLRSRIKKSAVLQQVLADARTEVTDMAELRLYERIQLGEAWAVCFYLKTQARDRGYVEQSRHELIPPEGGAVEYAVRVVDYRDGLAALAPPEDDEATGTDG